MRRRTTKWNAYFLNKDGTGIGVRVVLAPNRKEAEAKALFLTTSQVSPLRETAYLHVEQATADLLVVQV